MYEKNTSFPVYGSLHNATSGAIVDDGATYLYSLDDGAAILGGGSMLHLGNGLWRVVPLPAETNGKTVAIILQAPGAISWPAHFNLWDPAVSTKIITMAGSNDASLDTVIDSISDGFQGVPNTSQIAAAVDVALIQAGDGADLIKAIADQIAQDWVAGDASPAAVLATIEASASYQTLIADAAAIRNDTENGVALSDQAMDAIADAENAADNAGQVAQVAAQTAGNIYAIVNNATHGNPALASLINTRSDTIDGTVLSIQQQVSSLQPTILDVNEEDVPKERTAEVVRQEDGLVDVSPIRLTVGDEGLLCAIDFAQDLAPRGRVIEAVELSVVSTTATTPGKLLLTDTTRHGAMLKFKATAIEAEEDSIAGDYMLFFRVRYSGSSGITAGHVRATVANTVS